MKIKHQNVNLLFFLNGILGSVLDSLTGSFEKSAKYEFNRVLKGVNKLEAELLKSCDLPAHETYNKSTVAVAAIINVAIEFYNKGEIDYFLNKVNQIEKELK